MPTQKFQHHYAAKNDRTRIDAIESRMFGRCTVRRLKNGSLFSDVGSRCHAQSAHHGCCCIRDVIPVQVQRCQDRILLRAGLDLLKNAVGDAVVNQHHLLPLSLAMAAADGIDHGLNFGIEIGLFLGGEAVVSRLDHAGVVLHAQR